MLKKENNQIISEEDKENFEKIKKPWWYKMHKFFDKIAFLDLPDSQKTEIADRIINNNSEKKLYRLEIILSTLICTLGLLINSVPVIIGAMLISPLLNPIKTFSFAVTTGNRILYLKALKNFFFTIIISVFVSYIITKIIPFASINDEIQMRTTPTIIDLFIALGSGILAFLSLKFKKLSETIAGVAMSAALLPPLCVSGIGLRFLDMNITLGSFLLFLANLVAIIIVGIIIFYFLGFYPTNKDGQKRSFTMTLLIIITIIFITIPLWDSLKKISNNYFITNTINTTFINFFDNIDKNIEFEKIDYSHINEDTIRVKSKLNIPDNIKITDQHKNGLTKLISLATEKSVQLDLDIVELSSIYINDSEKLETKDILKEKIINLIKKYKDVVLVDIKIAKQDKVLVLIELYSENIKAIEYEMDIKKNIELIVQEIYNKNSSFIIQRQRGYDLKKVKEKKQEEIDKIKSIIKEEVIGHMNSILPNSIIENILIDYEPKYVDNFVIDDEIKNMKLKYIQLNISITTPKNEDEIKKLFLKYKSLMIKHWDTNVKINLDVKYMTKWKL